MPFLYLVRHAKSSWKNPELEDSKRPLNTRGEQDAPEMGNRLKARGIKPDLVISSPAVRARKTAEVIAHALSYDLDQIKYDWELFHANAGVLLNVLRKVPSRFDTVFMFGHNPGLTYFANQIGGLDIDNIPTSGIVAMEFSTSWKKVDLGTGKFQFFDYPKKTKE